MGDGYLLVSAHHCAPDMGSEHAVGWNLVSRLARQRPLILVTQDNEFRPAVERGMAALRAQGCDVHDFYVRHGSRTDGRKNSLRLGYYLTYIVYQWRVYQLAKTLRSRFRIVAAHHLNIVGFREPGFLWKLDLPFLWGPVGGLVYTPRALFGELTLKMRLFLNLTEWITRLQFRLSPRVKAAYRATQRPGGAFIAATQDIGQRFQRRFGGSFHWIPETGAEDIPEEQLARTATGGGASLRLLWAGALVDRKPLGMLLDAIAALPAAAREQIELTVVGDGDSRPRYEAQAQDLGIRATFHGWVSHAQAQAHFSQADLFVLLSVKDLTTNVVFESLAHGLPVLCLDHHGYAEIVDDSCGVKIPIGTPGGMRAAIGTVLQGFLGDRQALARLAPGARQRARQFTWDRNALAIGRLLPPSL
ncbi:glycosyltransferase family 4 protein [Pelomonas sp. BJYL3]|uniref:glycosyltransferase family 4 protein n=1 Tax=Pelomonas sp. BJYL3 TaxID=2976697 RepID=UPI0022B36632|nr:glycosyltransferase family 4 protein [Pelomonas sp. BJYL3]